MSFQALLLVLGLGLVNWIAVEVIVTSVVFKDLREVVDRLGRHIKSRHPRIGEKVCYFLTCALCVGVWVGFVEASVFGGPLQPVSPESSAAVADLDQDGDFDLVDFGNLQRAWTGQ